jgi:TatD DNase family protein
MLIDTHAHFDMCFEEKSLTEADMLYDFNKNKIKYAVQISTEPSIFGWSYDFAKKNANVFFTIGIHPSTGASEGDLKNFTAFIENVISANDRKLVFGIGEIGLDYYRMHQPKETQKKIFIYQLDEANRYNLPVIIHSREAKDDTLEILRQRVPRTGIMHCFSGNSKTAKEFLDLGFYISFAGNLTYNKASDLHDAAKYVPADRLLLETDAPFLTPAPLRGKKNRPDNVMYTYQYISQLRKEGLSKIEECIEINFNNILAKNN